MENKETNWVDAKEQVREIIYETAKERRTISYSALVERITAISLSGPQNPHLYRFLDEISCEDDKEGKGLSAALVVHKNGDKRPGKGFYKMAEKIRGPLKDKKEFWIKETKHIYAYHCAE